MENIKKHKIQKDDTIKSIAEKYQLEIDELLSFHNSKLPRTMSQILVNEDYQSQQLLKLAKKK